MDPFCGGTALLGDSRVMVIAGTSPITADYGENKARIFTSGTSPTDIGSWSSPPNILRGSRRQSLEGSRSLPERFALLPPRPNPAAEALSLRFDLPAASHVRPEIYDLFGRRVSTLVNGNFPAGHHGATWNRQNGAGQRIAAGVYIARLIAGKDRAETKIALVP